MSNSYEGARKAKTSYAKEKMSYMNNRFVFLGLYIYFVFGAVVCYAKLPQSIDRMFYSEPYYVLEAGIYDRSERHAIYSYIIANLTTPGFDAMKYLPADDRAVLAAMSPESKYTKEILVEFLMTKMAENNRKEMALMTMWKNKKDGLQRIVTLGK